MRPAFCAPVMAVRAARTALVSSIPGIAVISAFAMPGMELTSAVRAARTAMTGAQNAGRMDSYAAAQRMGIKLQKRWLATLDNRTRHEHRKLDGQVRDNEKPFEVDGEEIRFPGDPEAAGYLVYNCRCTLIAAVDGIDTSDAKRRAKDPTSGKDEIVGNMTYEQWAEEKKQQQTALEVNSIAWYNSTVQAHISIDAQGTYLAARNGERNKGVYEDAIKKQQRKLEKSIASHVAQVEEHARKIQNPEKFDSGWLDKDDRQKQGLLKKWEKDLTRNAEQAEIEIEVWKERFENEQ